jgi:hypothetical protein
MPEYKLLDEYTIEIRPEDMGNRPDYYWYLLHKPADVRRQAMCLKKIFQSLPRVRSVAEYFGGVGFCSKLIHEIVKPKQHYIFDIDPFCVAHLKHMTRDWVGASVTSDQFQGGIDLHCFDFNMFTFVKFSSKSVENQILDAALIHQPRYIQITDSAVNKLHLNYKSYGLANSRPQGYFKAFSDSAYERWGYSVTRAYYHVGAAYLLLERGEWPIAEVEKMI